MSSKAISSEARTECEGCLKMKWCKMYVLQHGEVAWVCKDCREGKKK